MSIGQKRPFENDGNYGIALIIKATVIAMDLLRYSSLKLGIFTPSLLSFAWDQ